MFQRGHEPQPQAQASARQNAGACVYSRLTAPADARARLPRSAVEGRGLAMALIPTTVSPCCAERRAGNEVILQQLNPNTAHSLVSDGEADELPHRIAVVGELTIVIRRTGIVVAQARLRLAGGNRIRRLGSAACTTPTPTRSSRDSSASASISGTSGTRSRSSTSPRAVTADRGYGEVVVETELYDKNIRFRRERRLPLPTSSKGCFQQQTPHPIDGKHRTFTRSGCTFARGHPGHTLEVTETRDNCPAAAHAP